ncbi:MAG: ketoacyl-ACP synthase III [Gammaproteobacteria bacterium]|nr:ketoacyl-ACP synthase III [Gammaproteobacteria bacterium]
MTESIHKNCRIAGVSSCVPSRVFDNLTDTKGFPEDDIRKVVSMAGVKKRRISDGKICSSDLCLHAAGELLKKINWEKESIDALIMVTQTPDYFLPSTGCLIHRDLALSDNCATFDVGLGCSGYPYGLWLAAMMINSGLTRVLVLHGETPSLFTSPGDRSTYMLFGDAGSATAVEKDAGADPWYFKLHTDGAGYDDLIIHAGGFRNRFENDARQHCLHMDGAGLFNFTIKRVPPLIIRTLEMANLAVDDVDYYVFHQSNQFMMKHIAKKCGLPAEKTPIILDEFGNSGGPSVPLTITQGVCKSPVTRKLSLMCLGYGVGLSWGSALVSIDPETAILHSSIDKPCVAQL